MLKRTSRRNPHPSLSFLHGSIAAGVEFFQNFLAEHDCMGCKSTLYHIVDGLSVGFSTAWMSYSRNNLLRVLTYACRHCNIKCF